MEYDEQAFTPSFLASASDLELVVLQHELRRHPEDAPYLAQVLDEIKTRTSGPVIRADIFWGWDTIQKPRTMVPVPDEIPTCPPARSPNIKRPREEVSVMAKKGKGGKKGC